MSTGKAIEVGTKWPCILSWKKAGGGAVAVG